MIVGPVIPERGKRVAGGKVEGIRVGEEGWVPTQVLRKDREEETSDSARRNGAETDEHSVSGVRDGGSLGPQGGRAEVGG